MAIPIGSSCCARIANDREGRRSGSSPSFARFVAERYYCPKSSTNRSSYMSSPRAYYAVKMFNPVVRICSAMILMLLALPSHSHAAPTTAIAADDFLNSIGVVTSFPDRGQSLGETIEMIRYCGFRWVRAGIEGLSDRGPTTIWTFLELHRDTGVKFSWGLVSGGTDIKKLVRTGRVLADAGALLAIEGNNEPNNFGVVYQGEKGGGGRGISWMPVARLQRDLYQAVKNDAVLAN